MRLFKEEKSSKAEKKKKCLSKERGKKDQGNNVHASNIDSIKDKTMKKEGEKGSRESSKKRRKSEKNSRDDGIVSGHSRTQREVDNFGMLKDVDTETTIRADVSERACKNKRKVRSLSKKEKNSVEEGEDAEPIYQISSGDEDCSKGIKKWVMEYYRRRPGLKTLQQAIDDFITGHEEKEEQERKEREAHDAQEGWTVVTHHKGRKKTTESESGTTVGSVPQAVVLNKMAKKKNKEVGLNFYRFQRREAQRNEIMMLQSKFEQDRKLIQQRRAARKFRPY